MFLGISSSVKHDATDFCVQTLTFKNLGVFNFLKVLVRLRFDIGMIKVEGFSEEANFCLSLSQITFITIEFVHGVILKVLCFLVITGNDDMIRLRHEGITTLLNTTGRLISAL